MNPREYELMAMVEADHWWYRALRERLADSLARFGEHLPSRPSILDAGCGTGENLKFLQSLYQPRYLGGFDPASQAVTWARRKAPLADIYVGDVCAPDLHYGSYDIVLSCDVLYIPGLRAALSGMQTFVQRMRPGGLLLINVPAYNWLKSDHDLAIATGERFVAGQIRQFLCDIGLIPRLVTYRLCLLFPLVVASRLPSMLFPKRNPDRALSALRKPSTVGNQCMGAVMSLENRLIAHGLRLPWGSSVFAVGQRGLETACVGVPALA